MWGRSEETSAQPQEAGAVVTMVKELGSRQPSPHPNSTAAVWDLG